MIGVVQVMDVAELMWHTDAPAAGLGEAHRAAISITDSLNTAGSNERQQWAAVMSGSNEHRQARSQAD